MYHKTGGRSRKSPPTKQISQYRAVAETSDGDDIQVLELRGTIIRLREQLDRIHTRHEEKVQRMESIHRAQRRDLEDTIRHLRDRLQAAADPANDG